MHKIKIVNIRVSKTRLSNGLRVLFHYDANTPLASFNLLYNVGARDENHEKTGLAHLFEHLMFGGSKNVEVFDTPLQNAGGNNNAFTTNDITNYYITIPKSNVETAFWLESDRMCALNINQQTLDVQKKVVIEEFNQRYLNQPYGDVSLILKPLAYKVHPYQWSTIGKNVNQIESFTLKDVTDFYEKFYSPSNSILVVGGDFKEDYIFNLAEKWFGDIENKQKFIRNLPAEPQQKEARNQTVKREVSSDKIIISFPMCSRLDSDYYKIDMLTDILSVGISNRLEQNLVKKQNLFTSIDSYITGSFDPGQIIFTGYICPNVDVHQAEQAIWKEIDKIKTEGVTSSEMNKSINQIETSFMYENINVLNRVTNIAIYELLHNYDLINSEINNYRVIKADDIQEIAVKYLNQHLSSTLYYLKT